jgi:hypothetical protein
MGAKRFFLFGLPVVLLALGLVVSALLTLAGCVVSEEGDGYRMYFKVDNHTSKVIDQVEFINGDTANDKVVLTKVESIPVGQRSYEMEASGFDVEYGSSTRRFGVKVLFADKTTLFDWDAAGHKAKVLVGVYSNYMSFSNGNW